MRRLVFVVLLLVGCSVDSGVVLKSDTDGGLSLDSVVALDVTAEQVAGDQRVLDLLRFEIVPDAEDDVFVECLPGEGCFGEACTSGDDCLSGFCLDHMGNSVCSQSCITECPPGFACEPTQMGGSDLVYVCVSQVSVLCRPCANNSDCVSASGQEFACVDYGDQGRFCGAPCSEEIACPDNYECVDMSATGDGGLFQCRHTEGECPCSEQSVALALLTVCSVTNESGTCNGKRVCEADGLSACDAAIPSTEVCDGTDNNCDGQVDEDSCNDDNPCTEDVCGGESGCVHTPLDGGNCDDGDVCTVTDHCENGICVGTAVECDDGNPCTDDVCDGTQGCLFEANNAPCDDGDPCSIGDLCLDGTCQGTAVECECVADEDCAELEDGDLCNGTLFCDKSGVQYQCKVAPNTVVECPEAPGKDGPCLASVCAPETGKCSFVPANEGGNCNDKDSCTYNSTCVAGECAGGQPVNCNDGNPCTEDDCQPGVGCVNAAAPGNCSDGDACTWPDQCNAGVCQSGPALACDDGNPCTADTCDAGKGCQHAALDGACDDGNVCTTGDQCLAGVCTPSGVKACDDANPCTNDSCQAEVGCVHTPNDATCSDDNLCTVNDLCSQGNCTGGGSLNCDDGNPCTNDTCNPLVGCKHTAFVGPCDDSDPCTEGDTCSGGECVGTQPLDCDDDNPCTNDICVPMAGCSHTNNKNPCDDGNSCTVKDLCSQGFCVPGGDVDCDDGNVCTDDSCDAEQGCLNVPNDSPCDDANSCTTTDVCADGFCQGQGSLECDDANPCTKDICLPEGGCQHESVDGACSDGNPCTLNDFCGDGSCQAGLQKDCDDGNPCTDDSCDDTGACQHLANDADCDDGNPCTVGDHCEQGTCQPTDAADCDDDNICTSDYCHPLSGCTYELNSNPCNDGSACTVNDICSQGTCQGGAPVNCNDGNVCTDDSCHPETGCIYAANEAACDDGNLCTLTDVCQGGICKGSGVKDCSDNNGCTDDSCSPEEGCVNTNNTQPCDDGNACTTTDLCADGECVGSGALECNDGNLCTDDSCDSEDGCTYDNNAAACNDSNACTTTDVCSGGQCVGSGSLNCNDNDVCTDDSCDADQGCVNTPNANCCTPSGNRAPFNSLSQDSASGCWNGNVCSTSNYSWGGLGQAFASFGQSIACSGNSTCVQHVGITTYTDTKVCQGKWDVYCNNVKKCTILTLGKSCTGSSLSNGCQCTFAKAANCSTIKLVAVSDGDGTASCCGSGQPDTMITSVSAW